MIALDVVDWSLEFCSRRGRWVIVATRIHRANPEHRYRSDHIWRGTGEHASTSSISVVA